MLDSGRVGIFLRKCTIATILLCSALCFSETTALSAQPAPNAIQRPQAPSLEQAVILIRSTLGALNQANLTNNYTVFRAFGSQNFTASVSVDKLSAAYQNYRANKIDLSEVEITPLDLHQVAFDTSNVLILNGTFHTRPGNVNILCRYVLENNRWKLLSMNMSLTGPTPFPSQASPKNK